jgi:hypothetical protein
MDWEFFGMIIVSAAVIGTICTIISLGLESLERKINTPEEKPKDQYPTDNKPITPGR